MDQYYEKNVLKALFTARKSEVSKRRRKKDIEFFINYTELEKIYKNQNGRCFFTGIPLEKGIYGGPSIERIESNGNYDYDNCVLSFTHFNNMKSDIKITDFLKYIVEIVKNNDI